MPRNWGILGSGYMARKIIPSIQRMGGNVIAVGTRSPAPSSLDHPALSGIPQLTYEEMMRVSAIDTVYIALPNSLHAKWIGICAANGKNVVCEKPLVLSTRDFDEVYKQCEDAKVSLIEAFMYRHHDQWLTIRALCQERVKRGMGLLTSINVEQGFMLRRDRDIRREASLGGGAMWDEGCYGVHAAVWLAGAPFRVTGTYKSWPGNAIIDEHSIMVIEHASGVMSTITASHTAHDMSSLKLYFENGTVTMTRPFNPKTGSVLMAEYIENGDRDKTTNDIGTFEPENVYDNMMEDITRSIGTSLNNVWAPDYVTRQMIGAIERWREYVGLPPA